MAFIIVRVVLALRLISVIVSLSNPIASLLVWINNRLRGGDNPRPIRKMLADMATTACMAFLTLILLMAIITGLLILMPR